MSGGFVSYAQNFEDVMLWRALSHVDCGFYIDIGAQHPTIDSVSLAFYERGWRGVDIEPVPEYAALLRQHRPENEVIEAVVSNVPGTAALTVVPDTGWSTASKEVVDALQVGCGGAINVSELDVQQYTLAELNDHYSEIPVHWMKIDVEGLEQKVLEGWDPSTLRPWILVIEATFPNSNQPNYASWESIVLEAGYQCVYQDGLNRFYLAEEHSELGAAFEYPPNVFDDIRLRHHSAMLQDLAAEHIRDIQAREARAAGYQRQVIALQHYQAKYEAIIVSASWRLTAPLRRLLAWLITARSLLDRWLKIKGWKNRISAIKHLISLARNHQPIKQEDRVDFELTPQGRLWLEELQAAYTRSKDSN